VTSSRTPTSAAGRLASLISSDPDRLYRRARSLGLQHDDAADVAQTVALKALEAATLRSTAEISLCAWLDAVTRNTANDAHRKGRRSPADLEQVTDVRSELPKTDPEREAVSNETITAIREVIATMPATLAVPLILSIDRQASGPEIARQLHLSPATVRQRLHRARALVASRLEELEIQTP
jgi:RNA polymerase sigma-70 factor (ECF subfamily)